MIDQSIEDILGIESIDPPFDEQQLQALRAHWGDIEPYELEGEAKRIYEVVEWTHVVDVDLPQIEKPDDGIVPQELVEGVASMIGIPNAIVELVMGGIEAYCDICFEDML